MTHVYANVVSPAISPYLLLQFGLRLSNSLKQRPWPGTLLYHDPERLESP